MTRLFAIGLMLVGWIVPTAPGAPFSPAGATETNALVWVRVDRSTDLRQVHALLHDAGCFGKGKTLFVSSAGHMIAGKRAEVTKAVEVVRAKWGDKAILGEPQVAKETPQKKADSSELGATNTTNAAD